MCFSAGNLLLSRMQSMGLHPFATNSWAMLIGASVLTIGSALAGYSFAIEPERAAYCTVLFPIVALAASTVFRRLPVDRIGGGWARAGGGRQSGGVRFDAAHLCASGAAFLIFPTGGTKPRLAATARVQLGISVLCTTRWV
jgi:hypothetical protein